MAVMWRARDFGEAYAPATPGVQDLAAWMTTAVERMELVREPFLYGVVDDFLPPDLFQRIRRPWPDLKVVSLPGLAAGYLGSRATHMIEEWRSGRPSAATGDVDWDEISRALRSRETASKLFQLFGDCIGENIDEIGPQASDTIGFRSYLCGDHGRGDAVRAHVDPLRKLITIVLYVDLEGSVDASSADAWGTAIYDEKLSRRVAPLEMIDNAELPLHSRVKFAPNRAFIMPNRSHALHGVPGGQDGVTRRTVMCGYWLFSD